jgi:hypothetical protein
MKSFVAVLSYLAALALAAPVPDPPVLSLPVLGPSPSRPFVVMNIANDALGLTGVSIIRIDGDDHAIGTIYANTFLAKAAFQADTAYLTYYPPHIPFACTINAPSHPIDGVITSQNTIIKFGDGRNALNQVDLAGATVNCDFT